MEYIEEIKKTGEWWINPWWLDPDWTENEFVKLSREDIETAVDFLKTIFTKEWLLEYDGRYIDNIFLRNILYSRGLSELEIIYSLSTQIQSLYASTKIDHIISGLKTSDRSESSQMELEMGYAFHECDYVVEFPVPSSKKGKTPDIYIIKGEEKIFLECKRLNEAEFEIWIDNFFMQCTSSVFNLAKENEYGFIYEFNESIIPKLHKYFENHEGYEYVSGMISNVIRNSVDMISAKGWMWSYIDNIGIGSGYFSKNLSDKKSRVSKPDIPDKYRFYRLFSNGVDSAIKQLINKNVAGIAAIHVRAVPDYMYLRDMLFQYFNDNAESCLTVVGILVFPWQNLLAPRTRPVFITNYNSKFDFTNYNTAEVIKMKFDPIWY